MGMIEAYIDNLGKYVEGKACGEYLYLPASTEEVQALLKKIGVDGKRYEEIIITDYKTEIEGLMTLRANLARSCGRRLNHAEKSSSTDHGKRTCAGVIENHAG